MVRHARVTAELGPWEVNGNPTTVINSNSQKAQQLDSKRHSFVAVDPQTPRQIQIALLL